MMVSAKYALIVVFAALHVAFGQELMIARETGPVVIETGTASDSTYLPTFNNGTLFVRYRISSTQTEYSAYARDGALLARFTLDLPGYAETIGGRIAALRNAGGYVAVCIGVNGIERTAHLCFLDRKGALVSAARTSPLWPSHITVASDGTIWGFGAAGREDRPQSDDPVLFQFSSKGQLLGTALPRRLFGADPPFEISRESGEPALVAAGDSVYVYEPRSRQLFEVGLNRSVRASYTVASPSAVSLPTGGRSINYLRGIAPMPDGTVYARVAAGSSSGIFALDRQNSRWVEVSPAVSERFQSRSLIGVEGDEIAICPAGDRGSTFTVTWMRLQKRE